MLYECITVCQNLTRMPNFSYVRSPHYGGHKSIICECLSAPIVSQITILSSPLEMVHLLLGKESEVV